MKTLKLQKRLSAEILGVGINSVIFDEDKLNEINEAITNQDIKQLIKEGAIKKRPNLGIKRRAGKIRDKRKKKGRRRRAGKIRKKVYDRKGDYIKEIRVIRKYLENQREAGKISNIQYKTIRNLAKSGKITNKRELINHLKEHIK